MHTRAQKPTQALTRREVWVPGLRYRVFDNKYFYSCNINIRAEVCRYNWKRKRTWTQLSPKRLAIIFVIPRDPYSTVSWYVLSASALFVSLGRHSTSSLFTYCRMLFVILISRCFLSKTASNIRVLVAFDAKTTVLNTFQYKFYLSNFIWLLHLRCIVSTASIFIAHIVVRTQLMRKLQSLPGWWNLKYILSSILIKV